MGKVRVTAAPSPPAATELLAGRLGELVRLSKQAFSRALLQDEETVDTTELDSCIAALSEQGYITEGGGWSSEHRGSFGETPLHVCALMDSEVHTLVAVQLLKAYPGTGLDVYSKKEYEGEAAAPPPPPHTSACP